MPRRVQDIVPNDRRSIRDVPVKKPAPAGAVSKAERARREKADAGEDVPIRRAESKAPAAGRPAERPAEPSLRLAKAPAPARRRKKIGSSFVLAVLGLIILVSGAAFVTSTRFARATFTLIPKSETVSIDRTYTFSANAAPASVAYQLATLTDSATTSVPATTGAAIQSKAQGTVSIYNTYSAQSQRLVAGSRLTDDSGLIYRLASSVVVPGYKASNGSTVPGMATASIVADQPGPQYNISRDGSISDFKFVAYKGTAKYTAIYARLASEVTGGFVGAKKIVNPALVASTTDVLKAKLTAALLDRIQKSVPDGYIMYPTGYATSFGAPAISGGGAYTADVSLRGTIYGIIFKRSDLVATLVGPQTAASFGQFGYAQTGLESLAMNIVNAKDFSPAKKNLLIAGFKGQITLTGAIPADDLKKRFAGASLDDMKSILKPYDAVVDSGSGELSPPWARVPTDISRISVVIKSK